MPDATEAPAAVFDDAQACAEVMKRFGFEIQVGNDDIGWQVRVRGHDPVGVYREVSYTQPGAVTMVNAMRMAAETFRSQMGYA